MKKTKFKQTEIGMIPEDWEIDVLGDHTNLIKGISYRSEDYCSEDEGFIFINLKCVARNGGFRHDGIKYYNGKISENQFVKQGDILIANTDLTQNKEVIGSPLKIPDLNMDKKICISLDLSKLDVTSKELNGDFLYYYLMSPKARHFMISNSNGTTVIHLSTKNVPKMNIPLPEINEQKAITKILLDLDSKIKLCYQINNTLELIGRTLFNKWLNSKDVPEDWETKSLDEIADFLNGLALQKFPAQKGEEYLPVIKIRELRNGVSEQTDKASLDIPEKYIIKEGDVLFSWSGSLEVVIWTNGRGALNQHLFKVSSKEFPKWFYYYWTKHHLARFRHIAKGKATTMGHIQRHNLTESEIILPDKKSLEKMDKLMTPIIERIIYLNLESRNLANIRDSLLPRLMSGKIRVPVEVN